MSRIVKIIVKYSFIAALIGSVLLIPTSVRNFGFSLIMVSLLVGQLAGLIGYLIKTDIYRTIYFKIIISGTILIIFGSVFKIQHWTGFSTFYLFGLLIITITYFIRFLLKRKKSITDYTKILWLFFNNLSFFFKLNHWILQDLFFFIALGIFWIGLLFQLYIDYYLMKTISNHSQ